MLDCAPYGKARIFAAHTDRRSSTAEVALCRGIRDGMTWGWKGATVTLVILTLLIAILPVSAIAAARAVARDGHGRRPDVEAHDSRRPVH